MRLCLLMLAAGVSLWMQAQTTPVKERIALIESDVPLEYNATVHSYVNHYLSNYNNSSSEILERFRYVEPVVDSVFKAHNIPLELKYLTMALTECTNSGEYTADKTGMFRINMETARKHNVLVSRYVDKRRDPITSAEVVAKELSNHYMEYANWKDAVLAFLSGVERFDTYKSNTSTGLAELNNYYKFVAASYLAFFHESHRIFASNKLPEKTRKVPIEKLTTLYQLATNLNVDYEVMKELNAVYVKEIVPSKSATVVTIPEDRSEKFKALGAGIYNYANIEVFTATEIKLAGDLPQLRIEKGDSILDETGTELIYHVRKDDILIKVADYFDCDVVQIKRWNNLKDDYLDIDQPLIIKVPREKFKYYSRVDLMTRKERKKHAAKD